MSMFRSVTLGAAASLALAASANAADLGYKDSYAPVWTGFYIGANGGYASDARGRHGGIEDNGGFGGGQIGYNWQGALGVSRNLVLGIEADFQGTGIDHTADSTLLFGGGRIDPVLHTRSFDYFGTLRGRLGYAAGPVLFYGTAGLAYGNEKNVFDDFVTGNVYRANSTQIGYAAGGGVEYKIDPAWSLKVEYQYVELNSDQPVGTLGGFVRTRDTELDTVRGGINYHF
jgi:outer membrane immunogenic protein